eukprot:1156141-Pelagomonas_calceolata.AAC.1
MVNSSLPERVKPSRERVVMALALFLSRGEGKRSLPIFVRFNPESPAHAHPYIYPLDVSSR